MLSEYQKSRIRIHLGVPVLGLQNSGFALGYRFTTVMGTLEYRMNNLQPFEESQLTGYPVSAVMIYGKPTAGDTVTTQINALTATTYTVVAADANAADPLGSVAQNTALAVNQALKGVPVTASFAPALKQPYPTASTPSATLILQNTASATVFTTTATSTGNTTATVISQGNAFGPSITFQEDGITVAGYIPVCDYLESKVAQSSDLLKYSKADVVTFRPDELAARRKVYRYWRESLAKILGVTIDPQGAVDNSGGSKTGLVV